MLGIPEFFKSRDALYHYTKMDTALEHILWNRQLRFSPRKNSVDLIESSDQFISFHEQVSDSYMSTATNKTIMNLRNEIQETRSKIRQICFCRSREQNLAQGIVFNSFDNYGFLKPRMWDQYAHGYKGVCLAFSISSLTKEEAIFHEPVNYNYYSQLKDNHISIDTNQLLSDVNYQQFLVEQARKELFRKHIDYQDESEYRVCTFAEEEIVFMDIQHSLRGIIVSTNHLTSFNLKALQEYAEKYQIALLTVSWKNTGPHVQVQRSYVE